MSYGSGQRPSWHQPLPPPYPPSSSSSSPYSSYQQSGAPLTTAVRTASTLNHNASAVLGTLSSQREQLLNARDSARATTELSKLAKSQLKELRSKARRRVLKLYSIIALLATADAYLLLRMISCGGSLFCS